MAQSTPVAAPHEPDGRLEHVRGSGRFTTRGQLDFRGHPEVNRQVPRRHVEPVQVTTFNGASLPTNGASLPTFGSGTSSLENRR